MKLILLSAFCLLLLLSFSIAQSENQSFNVGLTIPESYKKISAGDELISSIKIINLGSQGRVDVVLELEISSHDDRIILNKKETVAVETQANFIRNFKIPADALPGEYKLKAEVVSGGKEFIASSSFEIVKKQNKSTYYLILIILAMIILIILAFLVFKSKIFIERLRIRFKVRKIIKSKLRE
jgi:uncharacterized membrane protein